MQECLDFFVWLHIQLLGVLNSIVIEIDGYSISYLYVIIGCLFLLMILAVFWKGARV